MGTILDKASIETLTTCLNKFIDHVEHISIKICVNFHLHPYMPTK